MLIWYRLVLLFSFSKGVSSISSEHIAYIHILRTSKFVFEPELFLFFSKFFKNN